MKSSPSYAVAVLALPSGFSDPDPANTSSSAYVNVTPPPPQADLSVTTTASPANAQAGAKIAFALVLSNAGPANVTTSIAVSNFLSPGLGYFADTGGDSTNGSFNEGTFKLKFHHCGHGGRLWVF
jgi:uncharacterized repeat protein (TIGR01451 family)